MRILLSLAAGMGGLSLSYTGSLFLFGSYGNVHFIPESLAIATALWFFFSLPNSTAGSDAAWWLKFIFYLFLVLSLATFTFLYLQEPHGGWDGWAKWNLKARFLFRNPDDWLDAFSPLLASTHPDYPLLLPALVARFWSHLNTETTLIPFVIALFFTFETVGLLVFGLQEVKEQPRALLAGVVLLGTPFLMITGVAQIADVPLAFFILAVFVLTRIGGPPLLTGFILGLACWTKNEGTLFALAFLLAGTVVSRSFRKIPRFLLGMLPSLILLLYLKIHVAPPTDLFEHQSLSGIFEKLADPSRYLLILKAALGQFTNREWNWFPIVLILYALLMGFKKVEPHGQSPWHLGNALRAKIRKHSPTGLPVVACARGSPRGHPMGGGQGGEQDLPPTLASVGFTPRERIENKDKPTLMMWLTTMGLMLLGYGIIFLIAPWDDLQWGLDTTLNRLLLQLGPAFLFNYFLVVPVSRHFPVAHTNNL